MRLWRKVMAVNLDGTFLGCKHAMPLIRKTGGSIVNISSVSGIVGGHNLAAYNASKGGVRLLSKSVALHGARQSPQVRCNSVHPTFIEGPMSDALFNIVPNPEEVKARMEKQIPLRRFGKPAEVAEMCVYLLSDEIGLCDRRRVRHRWRADGAVVVVIPAERSESRNP